MTYEKFIGALNEVHYDCAVMCMTLFKNEEIGNIGVAIPLEELNAHDWDNAEIKKAFYNKTDDCHMLILNLTQDNKHYLEYCQRVMMTIQALNEKGVIQNYDTANDINKVQHGDCVSDDTIVDFAELEKKKLERLKHLK